MAATLRQSSGPLGRVKVTFLGQPRRLSKANFLRFAKPHDATFTISRLEFSWLLSGCCGRHRSVTIRRSFRSHCHLIPEKNGHFASRIRECHRKVITSRTTALFLVLYLICMLRFYVYLCILEKADDATGE